jgi:hypothetical protein
MVFSLQPVVRGGFTPPKNTQEITSPTQMRPPRNGVFQRLLKYIDTVKKVQIFH